MNKRINRRMPLASMIIYYYIIFTSLFLVCLFQTHVENTNSQCFPICHGLTFFFVLRPFENFHTLIEKSLAVRELCMTLKVVVVRVL